MDLAHVRPILQSIATTIVPHAEPPIDRVWPEVEAVIARALAKRSDPVQRQLATFLRLVQVLPIARYGRSFTALAPNNRRAVLARLERSRILLMRRGFWAVRTLIFLGYYTRGDVAESIGYAATAAGWETRGSTVATVPLAPMLWVEP